ncbi:MAG: MFS transporter [Chloroflexota bacterium]
MTSTNLNQHRDFVRLWVGQTVSKFGSQIGALSLLAILTLQATPQQMGILATMQQAPVLLLSLFAGVWVDRQRRRPFLIATDLGRALLLAIAGLAALSGWLTMPYLYGVAFLVGGLSLLFNIAYQAYLPTLVSRERLVEANSKLEASASVAEIAAPGLGGILVQLVTAPVAVLVDAASFLVSAWYVGRIEKVEEETAVAQPDATLWQNIRAGWQPLWQNRYLRPLTLASATRNFFGGFFASLYSLYILRELGLSPVTLGVLVGGGGIGALVGALWLGRAASRQPIGRMLIAALFISASFAVLTPLAAGPRWLMVFVLFLGQIVGDTALTVYFITELTVRQMLTDDRVMGRVNATFEFLTGGAGMFGMLGGGILGDVIGIRPSLFVAVAGFLTAVLWLHFSPLRQLTE